MLYLKWVEHKESNERLSVEELHEWLEQNMEKKDLFNLLCESFNVYHIKLSKILFEYEYLKYTNLRGGLPRNSDG